MNIFRLRDALIEDYASFVSSYVRIKDPKIKELVESELSEGALWPDPLVQLNPSFVKGESIDELVTDGLLHPLCQRIFRIKRSAGDSGEPIRLYKHQAEAVKLAVAGESYILTTGTGSGKSLAYIIPIVDHILKHGSGKGIQAIIVYPMNALVNSQWQELSKFLNYGFPDGRGPVTFASYIGQESEEQKNDVKESPPDILLTNYVMLELILTRHEDRALVRAAQGLRFLVLDELHTYRGRQGADVAMLMRRAREAFSAPHLQYVGTSATLSVGQDRRETAREVAQSASNIFGTVIEPEHVISESLERLSDEHSLDDSEYLDHLRRRIENPKFPSPIEFNEFRNDPLVSWVESALGVTRDPETGELIRQEPRSITAERGASRELSRLTGIDEDKCRQAIEATLVVGNRCIKPDDKEPAFAFRLHQFISRGDTVYASLDSETDPDRYITIRGQKYVPGGRSRILLPLVFCRECGQAYYSVWRVIGEDGRITYRPRDLRDLKGEEGQEAGFLYQSSADPWPEDGEAILDRLPEDWLDPQGRVRKDRRKLLPKPVRVGKDGLERPDGDPWTFVPAPFRFCLTCGVSYDFSSHRTDFAKLAILGTEGRSTATTILTLGAIRHMEEETYQPEFRKLLSFTDNRQDASLQAGHFNDFVEVGLLRSALYRAVEDAGPAGLTHDELARKVFDQLRFPFEEYAHDPGVLGPAKAQTDAAMREVLAYRLYHDLRRGWRVLAPNLEQVALLRIEYPDLAELIHDERVWETTHPALAEADLKTREEICRALLDHIRRELAIRVDYLDRAYQERLLQRSHQHLDPPWGFDENETLKSLTNASIAFPRSRKQGDRGGNVYLSPRSRFGRYLRRILSRYVDKLSLDDTGEIIADLFESLRRYGIVVQADGTSPDDPGFQLSAAAMRWCPGDGRSVAPDVLRQPTASRDAARPNEFFLNYYKEVAPRTRGIRAREHTAQVPNEVRQQREQEFRTGKLPILFCSPTMELGIDIAQLNMVNMRNVPPTPANYAQRSGRAGRNGQPALVSTYCSGGSPHDRYFFRHPDRMVAGAVAPPRVDLTNEDLLRAHIHAIWLSETGLSLGTTLTEILDMNGDPPRLTLNSQVEDVLHEPGPKERARARARAILATLKDELAEADWYHDGWLDEVLAQIPLRFDAACQRWRDLYRSAYQQATRQGLIVRDVSRPAEDRKRAARLRRDAETQLQLLTEPGNVMKSDFYSYRYFASEGFLPGYNFPRLPLSAYIPGRVLRSGDEEFLSRPRFLAITEFAPRAIVYHEGSQYEIHRVMLPAQAEEDIQTGAAKICEVCGYLHPCPDGGGPDKCEMCGADLPPPTRRLFRLRNVITKRRERITCDEEERRRQGYEVRTVIRFATREGRPSYRRAEVRIEDGDLLAEVKQGQAATLWRINFGWKRSIKSGKIGFKLDIERGYWERRQDDEDADDDPMGPRTEYVIPYVEDSKNCLIFSPAGNLDLSTMASLQAAMKSAVQRTYELEDRELAAEPLPDRDRRRSILFYEATEGGLGVLRRLLDPRELRRVARTALEICHFDPETGEDLRHAPGAREDCETACYDCLLSYTNQRDHEYLDRHLIKEFLLRLSSARVEASPGPISREEQLNRLMSAADSELEREWLRFLESRNLRLPSRAQSLIESCGTRPDFVYEEQNVAIYVDGPPHDYPERAVRDRQQVECMEDLGWTVIRFGYKDDWESILEKYPSVFGGGG